MSKRKARLIECNNYNYNYNYNSHKIKHCLRNNKLRSFNNKLNQSESYLYANNKALKYGAIYRINLQLSNKTNNCAGLIYPYSLHFTKYFLNHSDINYSSYININKKLSKLSNFSKKVLVFSKKLPQDI